MTKKTDLIAEITTILGSSDVGAFNFEYGHGLPSWRGYCGPAAALETRPCHTEIDALRALLTLAKAAK